MTITPRSFTVPIVLTSTATLVAILGFAAFISVGDIPPGWHPLVRGVSLLIPSTLIALSIALLMRRFRLGASATPWLFAALAILGAGSALLFSGGFTAGMDDADAGRPIGLLGSLTWLAALAGVVFVGAAIAVPLSAFLAQATRLARPVRALVAGGVGLLVGIPVFASALNPSGVATAGLALAVLLAVLASRDAAQRRGAHPAARGPATDRDQPPTSVPGRDLGAGDRLERTARTAQRLGVLALVFIVLVWGIGAAVGVALSGRPEATTAMGLSAAFATFAAIPLLVAVAAIGSVRAPRLAWRRLSPIAIVGSLAGTTIQLAATNPDGSALFAGAITTGLSLGAWLALTLVPLVPVTLPTRSVLGVAIALGGCLAWFMFVPGSGGIALVLPAAVLAFGARSFVGLPGRGRVTPTPA